MKALVFFLLLFGAAFAQDYDYAGAKAAGLSPVNGHWPDTYKLPSHITFSCESIYSVPGREGGTWFKVGEVWHYRPSAFVLQQHTRQELIEYFRTYERGSVLELKGP